MTSPNSERRRFLGVLTAAFGAVMGAIAVIPGLAFLAHPLRRDAGDGGDEPIPVGGGGLPRPGRPMRVSVVGDRRDAWLRLHNVKLGSCWLVRAREAGPVKAYSTICPHLGCGIDWNETR